MIWQFLFFETFQPLRTGTASFAATDTLSLFHRAVGHAQADRSPGGKKTKVFQTQIFVGGGSCLLN
ncbi:MAG: hypothetical protein ACI87E_000049 [Mariniblastus sp.]|jgi:hypothetical protein